MRRGARIGALPVESRWVYTVFLLLVLVGLVASAALYADRLVGRGLQAVADRYLDRSAGEAGGGSSGTPDSPAPHVPGPVLDLGDEPDPELDSASVRGAGGDSKRGWILEILHMHSFGMGLIYLVLAHLFAMSGLPATRVRATVVAAGLAALGHALSPLLIWSIGGLLWMMPVSGAALAVTWGGMVLWTLWAMWRPRA